MQGRLLPQGQVVRRGPPVGEAFGIMWLQLCSFTPAKDKRNQPYPAPSLSFHWIVKSMCKGVGGGWGGRRSVAHRCYSCSYSRNKNQRRPTCGIRKAS